MFKEEHLIKQIKFIFYRIVGQMMCHFRTSSPGQIYFAWLRIDKKWPLPLCFFIIPCYCYLLYDICKFAWKSCIFVGLQEGGIIQLFNV